MNRWDDNEMVLNCTETHRPSSFCRCGGYETWLTLTRSSRRAINSISNGCSDSFINCLLLMPACLDGLFSFRSGRSAGGWGASNRKLHIYSARDGIGMGKGRKEERNSFGTFKWNGNNLRRTTNPQILVVLITAARWGNGLDRGIHGCALIYGTV